MVDRVILTGEGWGERRGETAEVRPGKRCDHLFDHRGVFLGRLPTCVGRSAVTPAPTRASELLEGDVIALNDERQVVVQKGTTKVGGLPCLKLSQAHALRLDDTGWRWHLVRRPMQQENAWKSGNSVSSHWGGSSATSQGGTSTVAEPVLAGTERVEHEDIGTRWDCFGLTPEESTAWVAARPRFVLDACARLHSRIQKSLREWPYVDGKPAQLTYSGSGDGCVVAWWPVGVKL